MMRLARHDLAHADGRRLWVYGETAPPTGGPIPEPDGHHGSASAHLRFDQLSQAWVGIVPARNKRPASGAEEVNGGPACPLCAGGLEVPFDYDAAVFENRFPAMRPDAQPPGEEHPLLGPALGHCEVVLYTSEHDASLGSLAARELTRVIAIWRDRSQELWADSTVEYVLVFENRGAAVGATLGHPHGQIYALAHIPPFIEARAVGLRRHRERRDECWFCTCEREPYADEREILRTDGFVSEVPFAPRWPYETRVRARRHGLRRLADLRPEEERDLAVALHHVTSSYDRLFDTALPYMMAVHEGPDGADDWHLSFDFLPAARTADMLKIRGSVETATGFFVNDVLPEDAARELSALAGEPLEVATDDLFEVEPLAGPHSAASSRAPQGAPR